MLVQSHREYSKSEEQGCFAVGSSEKEIFKDLRVYCSQHPKHSVYYCMYRVRPSKKTYRPEYMMEIVIKDRSEGGLAMLGWVRVQ